MKNNYKYFLLTALHLLLLLPAGAQTKKAGNTDTTTLNFTVEEAPEWNALFKRYSGWFGGDGIFSIPLNGSDKPGNKTKTLFLFSDTLLGEIKNDSLPNGFGMLNNSVAYLDGEAKPENVTFYYKNTAGKDETMFVPNTPNSIKGDYYWLGDGFVNTELNDNTYILAYRVRNINPDDMFGFKVVGSNLIKLKKDSKPPFTDQQQMDAPFYFDHPDGPGYLGVGLFNNTAKAGVPNPDGYVYVYGLIGKHNGLVVARVQPKHFEEFDKWRYWDGKTWNTDIKKIAPVTTRASHELSVTPLPDGRYALVFQVDGTSKTVGLRIGTSPAGPFGPIINVYECPEPTEHKNFFAYNAKVHEHLSKPGELLISYNINSLQIGTEIYTYPNLYRPRFIRLKLK